jgi:Raf kinase inhibitor-like YbhB/YbcL family protein
MKLQTPVFEPGGKIPSLFTCDGKDINPALKIIDVPKEAKSLVLIMDDPDVPKFVREDKMYDHWVVYDIPPTIRDIAENSSPPGTVGKNTSGQQKYLGPCPPDREHRYFFKLYALDTKLGLPAGATKKEVEQKMKGHVIAQAELMGRYERIEKATGCC